MLNQIKVGVIGVGNMGQHHLKHYATLSKAKLTSICDTNQNLGIRLSKKYQTKYYRHLEQMLLQKNLEAISICVPTALHFSVAKTCLKQDIHILLEKPITTQIIHAQKLIQMAVDKKLVFKVGHIERFNPVITEAKKMIDNNQIGKIIFMSAIRSGPKPSQIKDTSIDLDVAIHDIDLAQYFMGKSQAQLVSKKMQNSNEAKNAVTFHLSFDATDVIIHANWRQAYKIRQWHIYGQKKALRLDLLKNKIEEIKNDAMINQKKVPQKDALRMELTEFLNDISNKKITSPDYALKALQIINL